VQFSSLELKRVEPSKEKRFQALMTKHHYLGSLPKIGDTLWYTALLEDQWVALLSFSSPALKCKARDEWIGWSYRHQYDRLKLVANNSRFLILPDCHYKNLASKILSHIKWRIQNDWQNQFGYPLLLLETFVDPTRYHGTIYRASNWVMVGHTRGYSRIKGGGYSRTQVSTKKQVFMLPLQHNSRALLSRSPLPNFYQTGDTNLKLTANQMCALPDFFKQIDDPRRKQGLKHRLPCVLAMAVAATLCGMRGYKDIFLWIESLGPKALRRFKCRRVEGRYEIPSVSVIRNVLISVDPDQLNTALNHWNAIHATEDESLAIDGKTMCNAVDEHGRQTHIMSAVGHQSEQCYTQKKSAHLP